jgi:hypothetical protein
MRLSLSRAAVLALVLLSCAALPPFALAVDKTRYRGHLSQYPSAPVAFAVSADRGTIMNFRAGQVPFLCDDGVVRLYEGLGWRGFDLGKSHGTFTRHYYKGDAASGPFLLEVNARLLPNGTVRGTLLAIFSNYNAPDCSTNGYLRWKAGD